MLSSTKYIIGVDADPGTIVFDLSYEGAVAYPPGYLDKAHIWLYINNVLAADSGAGGVGSNGFTWVTDTRVSLKAYVPVSEDVIEFRRIIPSALLHIDFEDRAGITAEMLDEASLANLYAIHQVRDGFGEGITDQVELCATYAEAAEAAAGKVGAYLHETYSGDGSTLVFPCVGTITYIQNIRVYVDGIFQVPTYSFTISSNSVVFDEAPPTGTHNIHFIITAEEA